MPKLIRRLLALLAVSPLALACGSLQPAQAVAVADIANNTLMAACAAHFACESRMSLKDAAQQFCSTLDDLQAYKELAEQLAMGRAEPRACK